MRTGQSDRRTVYVRCLNSVVDEFVCFWNFSGVSTSLESTSSEQQFVHCSCIFVWRSGFHPTHVSARQHNSLAAQFDNYEVAASNSCIAASARLRMLRSSCCVLFRSKYTPHSSD